MAALVFAFLLNIAAPASAAISYVIDKLDVFILVLDDNSYLVTETYEVADNPDIKLQGLKRRLPLRSPNGNRLMVSRISANGAVFDQADDEGIFVQIYYAYAVGKRQEGKINYILNYGCKIADDDPKNMGEFFCDIISNFDKRIYEMTFRIDMPHPFDASRLKFTHGPKDSKDDTFVEWSVDRTVITGRLRGANQPGEQLTVALPLPEGYFTPATGRISQRAEERNVSPGILLSERTCFILMLLASVTGFLLWYFLGRDQEVFPLPVVEFSPPNELTPAEVGYIMHGGPNDMDVISLIIYWAGKGYLHISEISRISRFENREEKGFLFRKLRDMDEGAKDFEKVLFEQMFQYGSRDKVSTFELFENKSPTTGFHTDLHRASNGVSQSFDESPETRIFKNTIPLALLVGSPSFVCLWIIKFAVMSGMRNPLLAVMLGSTIITIYEAIFLMAGAILIFLTFKEKLLVNIGGIAFMVFWISFMVIWISFTSFMISFFAAGFNISLLFWSGTVLLYVPLALMFYCRRRTELGLKYWSRLTGFRIFLETAERERIDMLAKQNLKYFYDILPYAIALGITDTWGWKFEDISIQSPEWYESSSTVDSFDTHKFASELSKGFSNFGRSVKKSSPILQRVFWYSAIHDKNDK
jgi:hypothetical protein